MKRLGGKTFKSIVYELDFILLENWRIPWRL